LSVGDLSYPYLTFFLLWFILACAFGAGYWTNIYTRAWFWLWGYNNTSLITDVSLTAITILRGIASLGPRDDDEKYSATVKAIEDYDNFFYDQQAFKLDEGSWDVWYYILMNEPSYSFYKPRMKYK
jgi:hypothetical protein